MKQVGLLENDDAGAHFSPQSAKQMDGFKRLADVEGADCEAKRLKVNWANFKNKE